MRYRHEKTGAEIEVKSQMGGCWKQIKEPDPAPPKRTAPRSTKGTAKK